MLAALVVVGLAVAAVLLFVLGGDDGDEPPDLSALQMEQALLTVEDVGDDFTEDIEDAGDELDPEELDTSDECQDLIAGFEDSEGEGVRAMREFQRGDGGESVSHEIVVPGEDSPEFDVLDDVVSECGEIGFDDGTFAGTMRITEGEEISVGERSFTMDAALEITSPQTLTFELLVVFWERDGVISTVEVTSPLGGTADAELAESLPAVADERLVEMLESAD